MKPEYALPIVILPWLWCFARLIPHHWRKDKFLRGLYINHREIWEELGQPCGCQWSAPGRIATPFSTFRFQWKWLRQDPEWLGRAPELQELFHQLRDGFQEWNFRCMPIMIGSALLFFLIVEMFGRHS